MEGTFTDANVPKEPTIGILVALSKNRFTKNAVNRAKESTGYDIILTDENDLYSDLINFIESRKRLDGSNNIYNYNFFNNFYNIVQIILLVFISFFVVLIWLNLKK